MCHCDRFKVEIVDIKRGSWVEKFRSEQEDLPLINIRPRVLSSYWQYPDKDLLRAERGTWEEGECEQSNEE